MRPIVISCVALMILFAVGCGQKPASGITVDPAFRTLIAPDTKLLAGVDIDSLKNSAFYQRHQRDLNLSIADAAADRMGVNPLRDISKFLAAWNGTNWLFLQRGRFNASDVQKKMIASGARATKYKGKTLLGERGTAMVFFKSVAAEGSDAAVRYAVELENAGQGEVPEELEARLRTLSKNDQVWAVSRGGLAFADMPMNPDMESALSNITGSVTGTTAGLYFDTGVHLSVDIQCVSDQGATRVHDGLRGIIGFARLSAKDNQEDLLRAYDAIQVNKNNQVVEVRANLPAELADKLIESLRSVKTMR